MIARIVGLLLIGVGTIWILQGVDLLPGSFMTGRIQWAVYGGIVCVIGLVLVLRSRRR